MNEIDSPLEYFFNFDHWHNPFRIEEDAQPMLFGALNASQLADLGLPPTARFEVTPLNESFFYIRMENLHDSFEQGSQPNYFINLDSLRDHIVSKIYRGGDTPDGVSVVIQEMALSGSELYRDMYSSKPSWICQGDDDLDLSWVVKDKNQTMLHLGPQRIRLLAVSIGADQPEPQGPVSDDL